MSDPNQPIPGHVPDSPKRQPAPPEAIADPLSYYKPSMVDPSPPDERDHTADEHSPFRVAALGEPPPPRPRRYMMPDPWGLTNQQNRGSCSAFAAAGQARTAFARVGRDFDPSEEVQYALVREVEGTLGQDSGAYPRDNQQVMQKVGVAYESDAPYLSQSLSWVPPQSLRDSMAGRRIDNYFVAGDDEAIKQTMWGTGKDDGFDVGFAFILYKNFNPDADNNIPLPAGGQWGGHNIRGRGYDDDRPMPDGSVGAWWVKNQWNGWGDPNGGAWISYRHANLGLNAGGLWRGDTWVSVVNGTVPTPPTPDPQPEPAPDPTPDPTPDPGPAPDPGYDAGYAAGQVNASEYVAAVGGRYGKRSVIRKVLLQVASDLGQGAANANP